MTFEAKGLLVKLKLCGSPTRQMTLPWRLTFCREIRLLTRGPGQRARWSLMLQTTAREAPKGPIYCASATPVRELACATNEEKGFLIRYD